MANTTDIAYCAGLIDGEGCIRIKKIPPKPGRRVSPGYDSRIHIRMVDEGAIGFLSKTLGGTYYKEIKAAENPNRRPMYCYAAGGRVAERILLAVLPYLIVKKEAAENALALVELKKTANQHRTKLLGYRNFPNLYKNRKVRCLGLSDFYIATCEKLYLRAKYLNRVGLAALED